MGWMSKAEREAAATTKLVEKPRYRGALDFEPMAGRPHDVSTTDGTWSDQYLVGHNAHGLFFTSPG